MLLLFKANLYAASINQDRGATRNLAVVTVHGFTYKLNINTILVHTVFNEKIQRNMYTDSLLCSE